MIVRDFCTRICSGGTPKSGTEAFYRNGNIPWLNTKEINFNRIWQTELSITELGYESSSTTWIKPHTIVVAMYGATAGRAAITEIPLTTNQACCNLEVDSSIADYRYIYYWLKNNYSKIAGLANGGAQQNLSAKIIKEVDIPLPSLSAQSTISGLLSSFDDKIDLNNRINDYLAA